MGRRCCGRGGGFWETAQVSACGEAANHGGRGPGPSASSELLRGCDRRPQRAHLRHWSHHTATMHRISRTSLASLVCPSAPFLAPRLLRTAVPAAAASVQCPPCPRLQRATFATAKTTKTAKKKKSLIRKIDHKQGKLGTRPPALSEEEQEVRLITASRGCAHNTSNSA